ncbi:hypothetical protein Efla_007723 [Eimeria flavescens]
MQPARGCSSSSNISSSNSRSSNSSSSSNSTSTSSSRNSKSSNSSSSRSSNTSSSSSSRRGWGLERRRWRPWEKLRDHIPLLRLQQQHYGERQQRLDAALQRMRIRPPTPQPLQQQQQQQQQQRQQGFPLRCLADVGSHCYMPAVASDASRLLISVGFSFYLEMDLDTAEAFLRKKKQLLLQ